MALRRKRCYVKQIDTVEDTAVWLVDGAYIRRRLNENFMGYDHHAHFDFIPAGELWIDAATDPREHRYFVERLLFERELIGNGVSYAAASHRAAAHERQERAQSAVVKRLKKVREWRKTIIARLHERKIAKYSRAVDVWLVNGKLVRDFFLVDYAGGGHDLVYPFIPAREIWIDQVLSPTERKFILLHEVHERFLMKGGKRYADAHHGATIVEDYYRDHPAQVDERLAEELIHMAALETVKS